MTALLLTLALFAAFWLIGLAVLVLVGADARVPRVALTAPAIGASATALCTFLLSYAGIPTARFAVALAAVLVIAATGIVALRRPALSKEVLAVIAISVVGVLITATPMFSFGFRWIANANDDMANYSLSAQQLIHNGLTAPIDFIGLLHGRDYATVLTTLHRAGSRPGSDLTLALVSVVTGRAPYEIFMPLIFALGMVGICSVGALTARDGRQRWAAPLAAALLALSPLATYGELQQLIAQVFGLAIAMALVALLFRQELHRDRARAASDIVPVGILLAGVILVYIELASTLAIAYALYVAALAWRRALDPKSTLRLWLGAAVVAVVLLNAYLPTELNYLAGQASDGARTSGHPPLFGYILMPSALPTTLGLQQLATPTTAPLLGLSILAALIVLVAALLLAVRELTRGSAVAAVLVADSALGAYLAAHDADFGLFKLAMYVQPLLAAGLALCLVRLRPRYLLAAVPLVIVLLAADLSTQHAYVQGSRAPGDFTDGSAADLLPVARRAIKRSHGPVVVLGDNPVYIGLTAINGYGHSVYFLSRDIFSPAVGGQEAAIRRRGPSPTAALIRSLGPRSGRFLTHSRKPATDLFTFSPGAERSLTSPHCVLLVPTGAQEPYNRLALASASGNLRVTSCSRPTDLLAFVNSRLGQSFYLPFNENRVSFYELQPDPFFAGHSMSALGQYALFEVLGATAGMRLEVSYTFSLVHDGSNAIPPSTVTGRSRVHLPVVGRGSARVFSAPLVAQTVDGHEYILLNVGERAKVRYDHRRGLDALFGTGVPEDTRRLTGYVRDISLVSAARFAAMRAPEAVSRFPADLANPDLEYSGVYEDGWVGEDSYFVLDGHGDTRLKLRASVPPGAARRLKVLVDGSVVANVAVRPGPLSLALRLDPGTGPRRVELRFTGLTDLPAPDYRPVSALLSYVGFST